MSCHCASSVPLAASQPRCESMAAFHAELLSPPNISFNKSMASTLCSSHDAGIAARRTIMGVIGGLLTELLPK